ncbi:hypothetical protein C5Y96_04980 [Blastopirellula marina]|uniref:Uncharacterized protein n=1 Tax=Blastopirellula marina TaxID=124 RepID=A0A2S8G470_9BACT|nr:MULTISPECIES: hypothetical protein [Pirellulaceae]PQO39213.1 hypothetical protein C5Y96_04980 [Blastopirellula marina]RCS55521.1 hypothetical protein DTL36_04990 [Bremerella cremea]
MSTEVEANTPGSEDAYHLDLLGTFHWVLAGICAVAGFFPILHVVFGFIAIAASIAGATPEPEARGMGVLVGVLFIMVGTAIIITFWVIAFCLYLSGSYLKAHKNHMFCLVMSVIMCVSFPLGTTLGVFSIIVLVRPSVKRLFGVD